MLQVFIDHNKIGLVNQVIFRVRKTSEIKPFFSKLNFNNFNITLSEIHRDGYNYYKVLFSQLDLSKNIDIIMIFIEDLFRVFLKIQLINGFDPHDLVLTIPRNKNSQFLFDLLHLISSNILITEVGKFCNIRHFDMTLFFSIVLTIIENK